MPGPLSHPKEGKTKATRHKAKHANRRPDGHHVPGSQNRNKNRG